MLPLLNDFVNVAGSHLVVASFGDNLAGLIQSIIGPIFLAIVGIVAINFLIQREMMKFVIFIVIAVLVAALIYVPSMIQNLGQGAGNQIKW